MKREERTTVLERTGDWFERPTSRLSFLRKLGTVAAAGAVAVLLPGTAKAGNAVCCPNTCSTTCGTGEIPFNCQDSCSGTFCCVCFQPTSNCIVKPCLC